MLGGVCSVERGTVDLGKVPSSRGQAYRQEYFDRRNDKAAMAAGKAYGEALQAEGVFVGGAGLESPQAATTVSIRDGKRQVHDGPYAETNEFLAGFGIIDVPDLDAALEWAARHPAAAYASASTAQ